MLTQVNRVSNIESSFNRNTFYFKKHWYTKLETKEKALSIDSFEISYMILNNECKSFHLFSLDVHAVYILLLY